MQYNLGRRPCAPTGFTISWLYLAQVHTARYMAVAGLSNYRSDHALAIANMALDMQKSVLKFNQKNPIPNLPTCNSYNENCCDVLY